MKIAILWTRLSGYMNACLKSLATNPDVSVFVSYRDSAVDAPFDGRNFIWIPKRYQYKIQPYGPDLLDDLQRFHPDIVLVSSWHIAAYRYVLRNLPKSVIRVLCMDNPWRGTLKQWLGVLISRWFLHPLYDISFLPGERQAVFAHKLGFPEERIWRGLYACDYQNFSAKYLKNQEARRCLPRSFVYVGRLLPVKGINTLVDAYQIYQKKVKEPWPLVIIGDGPFRSRLEGVKGVILKKFIQPESLPLALSESGCLILPSYFEPWGLVIHEAAAAGLPVICSNACGASVHLVQDGFNGFIFGSGNAKHLADAMERFTLLNDDQRRCMGHNSFILSQQFTPELWAANLYRHIIEFMKNRFGYQQSIL